MYDYIKGKLVSKQPASSKGAAIVVDNNNMGYPDSYNKQEHCTGKRGRL